MPDGSSSTCAAAIMRKTTTACCRAISRPSRRSKMRMSLDIAMGGSTNTVLHLLAAAFEAGVDFTMDDIDRLVAPRAVPVEGRSRPSRTSIWKTSIARGIMAILGQLERAGCSTRTCRRCTARRWATRSTNGTSRAPTTPRCRNSSWRRRAACRRRRRSARTGAGTTSTSTARPGLSGRPTTRSARTAGSRCCRATSRSTAAS